IPSSCLPYLLIWSLRSLLVVFRYYDICAEKKSSSTKSCLDAGHDVCQVLLGDPVISLAPVLLALEQATALHEPQVFGGHVAGDATRLGKFPHRVAASQEHLHHSQPVRVCQRLEAFSRLLQRLQRRELGQFRGLGRGGHRGPPYIPIYRNLTICQS